MSKEFFQIVFVISFLWYGLGIMHFKWYKSSFSGLSLIYLAPLVGRVETDKGDFILLVVLPLTGFRSFWEFFKENKTLLIAWALSTISGPIALYMDYHE